MNQFRRSAQSGFSLVELLAVVLILAVLAAVAIPLYINTRRASAARACKANIASIAAAESAWSLRNGSYNGTPMNDYSATTPGLVGAPEGLSAKVTCPLDSKDYVVTVSTAGALTIRCPNDSVHSATVGATADYTRTMAAPAAENIP